ncbi:hypothetical protein Tco_0946447 [Tanacetum coccineum]
MSPGNMCHRGTNFLTEKYVGLTVSLGIVVGERIPVEFSSTNIPQRQVARERYPQRQVAKESLEMSMGIVVNVVVALKRLGFLKDLSDHLHEGQLIAKLISNLEKLLLVVVPSSQASS